MLLILLAYIGGILTIVSPCILPVLPFVFSRAGQPFLRSGLPILAGMAATFALVASLAAIGGGWAVAANDYGRIIALIIMAVFGLTLIFPEVSERLSRPAVALGNRLAQKAEANGEQSSPWSSLLLGVATGLLWAPCAGPVLGLILTGAALEGASARTTLLLAAYAAGAATSLALALFAGGRIFNAMKGSLGAGEWIRPRTRRRRSRRRRRDWSRCRYRIADTTVAREHSAAGAAPHRHASPHAGCGHR